MQKIKPRSHSILPFIIYTVASCFYLYEYMLQVSPSVMTQELMSNLGLQAAGLGILSSFYFWAYAPLQLPAGLLFDRYSPRILLGSATLVCACGALLFCFANGITGAASARFLMGGGSAFAFIGTLILISRWFPAQYFAMFVGITQFMSSIGSIFGQVTLAQAIHQYGWYISSLFVAIFGFLLAGAIFFIVRDKPAKYTPNLHHQSLTEWQRLRVVCFLPQTWAIGLYALVIWIPLVVLAELWGIPFLMTKYNLTVTTASKAFILFWLGIGIGSPVMGWISETIEQRKGPLLFCMLLGFVSILLILYLEHISLTVMTILLFMMGFATSGQVLSFAVVRDNNCASHLGTATGFNNMLVLVSGAIAQPLVSWLLDKGWDGTLVAGAPVFSIHDYHLALSILPVCYAIGYLIARFAIKESYNRQTQPVEAELKIVTADFSKKGVSDA